MKKLISLFLILSFVIALTGTFPAAAAALPFRDVGEGTWFYEPVKTVYEAGIMKGTSNDRFSPNDPMTRGQIVTILARLSGDDLTGAGDAASFSDVARTAYYADPIGWAVKNGITKGRSATQFAPDSPVLRQEFAAFFVRYMKYKGISFAEETVAPFPDKVPDWAAEDIETLHRTGLVKGDAAGRFNPENRMTRAEIATVTARFISMTPADPMYAALETLVSMKCANHRGVHYTAGRSPVEAEPGDVSLSRIGAGLRDAVGLDPEKYVITVAPTNPSTFEEMHYEFPKTYDMDFILTKVSIKNVLTGEETDKKTLNIMLMFDETKRYDAVGDCPYAGEDEKMASVWDHLGDYYVFDDDGKIYVPYTHCNNATEFSGFFTRILFGLDDDNELGQDNGDYSFEVTPDDYAAIGALRGTGGDVTVTATLYNKNLKIRSEERTLTLSIMNYAQCVEKMLRLEDQLTEQMADLEKLIGDCERAGIPTDYEKAALAVLTIFAEEHIPDYIDIPDFTRELYLRRSTEKIYADAKASLEGYLSGEKEPRNVPKYASGKIDVDGFTLLADTVDSYGNFENRPVYFFGYGEGMEYPRTYAQYYKELGANTFHYGRLSVADVVRPATPSDTVGVSADGKYVIDTTGIEEDLGYMNEIADGEQAITLILVIEAGCLPDIYPELGKEEGAEGGEVGINLSHPKGREVIEAMLRAVIPLVTENPYVNNFVLTNEPAYKPSAFGDYYVPEWAEFLKDKYGTVGKLNEIYGASYSSFGEVPLADRDILIERDQLSFDNQEFATKVHSEWHEWVAGIAHELAPDVLISTKLKSIEFDRSMQQYGLRPEDWADFQDLGGCDDVRQDVMYYDHIAYAEDAPVVDSELHFYHDSTDTAFTYKMDALLERVIWRGMMHHLGIANFWSDDYWAGYSEHYSFGNSAYRPLARYKVGEVTMDLNRLSREIDAIVSEEPDVAILYSYLSRQFTTGSSTETMNGAYLGSLECGKKVRVLSEEQIEKLENENIKLLIIPESVNVYGKTLEAIDSFIKRGGKVIVFGFDSLSHDEFNRPRESALRDAIMAAADVYGIRTSAEEYRKVFAGYFKENGMQDIWVVDAATGEPVGYATEWMSGESGGSTVLSIYATDNDEPMTVRVTVDGIPVTSSHELRTDEYYGETFTLVRDFPILLELDADDREPTTAPDVPIHGTASGFEYAISDGGATVIRYTGGETDVTVPETLGGVPVTAIGGFAFTYASPAVTSVTLPATVTHLFNRAFYKCTALESVTIPGVDGVGDCTFCFCSSLRSVDIPEGVERIGTRAFFRCTALETVRLPEGLTTVDNYAFKGCSALSSLDLPSTLRRIGFAAFYGCSSISGTVRIPYGVTEILGDAFRSCSGIERVEIANSVIMIGDRAFEDDASLLEVVLPNSLKKLGDNVFTNDPLTRLDLPYGLSSLGSIHMYSPIYVPPTVNYFPYYWHFNGGVECEAGSSYERICQENGVSYTIVEREHHIHTAGAEPTCTSHQICTECGAVIRPSYGHVRVAGRGEDGKAVWICSVCGEKK